MHVNYVGQVSVPPLTVCLTAAVSFIHLSDPCYPRGGGKGVVSGIGGKGGGCGVAGGGLAVRYWTPARRNNARCRVSHPSKECQWSPRRFSGVVCPRYFGWQSTHPALGVVGERPAPALQQDSIKQVRQLSCLRLHPPSLDISQGMSPPPQRRVPVSILPPHPPLYLIFRHPAFGFNPQVCLFVSVTAEGGSVRGLQEVEGVGRVQRCERSLMVRSE